MERAYHHGTFLLDADLTNLGRYLKSPVREWMRGTGAAITSVVSPVANMGRIAGYNDLGHDGFETSLIEAFLTRHQGSHQIINVDEAQMMAIEEIREAAAELESDQWTFDKTPPFTLHLPPSLSIAVEEGIIKSSSDAFFHLKKLDPALFQSIINYPKETVS